MQERWIDKGILYAQADSSPRDVTARHDKFRYPLVLSRAFLGPPQHLGSMIAGHRRARELSHAITDTAVNLFYIWLTARVEPGIKPHCRLAALVDSADSRHLTVEGHSGHLS